VTAITGNTYPVRQELKALGGTWDAARKAWMVPDDKAAYARTLVNSPAARPKRSGSYRGGHTLSKQGGSGRGYMGTDENGHAHFSSRCNCEDWPCCGHN
jgi:hypothetical protein